jgi:hypothetical protein
MNDPKENINTLLSSIESGEIPANKAWGTIQKLKVEYVKQLGQQSWNSFIGHRFQSMIHAILKGYVATIQTTNKDCGGLTVLTEGEAKKNDVIFRKLAIRYGDFLLFPDVDSVITWLDTCNPWNSKILAIVSCKTSLRERIAQACYWKLKLVSSDTQKGVHVYLATADHDDDFNLCEDSERFNGKSRDRVIAEYELDGIYVLKDDFDVAWESTKVKRFERIFNDIVEIAKQASKMK